MNPNLTTDGIWLPMAIGNAGDCCYKQRSCAIPHFITALRSDEKTGPCDNFD